MEGKNYQGFKDLLVYQKARNLSYLIYKASLSFPKEERYALTDQIRRSSRAIGANIAESWPKRKYIKSFVSKLIDAQSESCETLHWMETSLDCKYLSNESYEKLKALNSEIQRMLESMIKKPEKFCNHE